MHGSDDNPGKRALRVAVDHNPLASFRLQIRRKKKCVATDLNAREIIDFKFLAALRGTLTFVATASHNRRPHFFECCACSLRGQYHTRSTSVQMWYSLPTRSMGVPVLLHPDGSTPRLDGAKLNTE